ncbi:MAG: ATP-dependent DNA helicase [Candidatus Paceibacterota bacterium]
MPGEEIFQKYYRQLNSAQKEAVDTIDGPVMVIAGPGTGKTQILTLRIANILLQTDTPPSGILALTFTEAGRTAMKTRLRNFIGPRADEVIISTYHGLAVSVIAEFSDYFPHLHRARQLSEVEAEVLLRDILRDKKFAILRPLGGPELYLNPIAMAIKECRKEAWTPDMVRDNATAEIKRLENDPASLSTRGATKGQLKAVILQKIKQAERTIVFADVYERYEAVKRERRLYDFDDLIFELLLALNEEELLRRLLQEKYLYLLVDEHQDTNNAQNLLIEKIADFYTEPNLFVVGDEKQAIYRFQGASVGNFLAFRQRFPTMRIIPLVDNYRSPQGLLDASFAMIENNYGPDEHVDLRIRLRAGNSDEPEAVTLALASRQESAEDYLVSAIQKIITTHPDRTVAVMARRNRDVAQALAVLTAAGIPAVAEQGTDVFGHPLGRLYFKLLEWLADESQTEALAYTLAGGLWGLDLVSSATLIKRLKNDLPADLAEVLPMTVDLKKALTRTNPLEFLILAADVSGLDELIVADPLATEVWRSIIDLAKNLIQAKGLADPRLIIAELLDYRERAISRPIKINTAPTDAQVTVMTAHGSKGLEYDYVFLPYATEETWLSKGRSRYFVFPVDRQAEDDIRDARRLFYVALTRAKRGAVVIVHEISTTGRTCSPLRFIDELDQQNLSRIKIAPNLNKEQKNLRSPGNRRREEFLNYTKQQILSGGLSVTALNHFITCPRKFFYKSILRLPEAPAAPAEKGNAMHEAIAAAWLVSEKTQTTLAKTLVKVINEYFRRSFLPSYEKESAVEELTAAAPQVATALVNHFSLAEGWTVETEKWLETSFSGRLPDGEINLRLHGKLDAIVNQAERVLVYDYKTKSKISERAIRGETKSADGQYFRQLVFYKILLAGQGIYRSKNIKPALVFVKPDQNGRCPTVSLPVTDSDIERVKGEIQALINTVWSGKLLETDCDDSACPYCQLLKLG